MAANSGLIGQTYNAKGAPVYPKVVIGSIIEDATVPNQSTDVFDSNVRRVIGDDDGITVHSMSLPEHGRLSCSAGSKTTTVLSVKSSGDVEFETAHIQDKDGVVNVFERKIYVDSSTVSFMDGSVQISDTSVTVHKTVDASDSSVYAKSLDASIVTTGDIKVNTDGIDIVKQYRVLPEPSVSLSEKVVQYVGPSHHGTLSPLNKYDFVRCTMQYTVNETEVADSSAYLMSDFESFEPKLTHDWLVANAIPNVDNIYVFYLRYSDSCYKVYVQKGSDYVLLGGNIYSDPSNFEKHRYCPYVWDTGFVPSSDLNLAYTVTFIPSNYVWKPIR